MDKSFNVGDDFLVHCFKINNITSVISLTLIDICYTMHKGTLAG